MQRFFEVVSVLTSLGAEEQLALVGCLRRHELPRGHVLLRPDTVCDHIYFVERGLTRTFYVKDGRDVTDWFSAEDSFAVSIVSFITRKPDRRGIMLLEDAVLWSLSYNDLDRLCLLHHGIERLGRLLVQQGVVQMQRRFDDLHFSTAHERLETLLRNDPALFNRATLGMIASYLGVTQETLSRIRARV